MDGMDALWKIFLEEAAKGLLGVTAGLFSITILGTVIYALEAICTTDRKR
jgi:hypothetical protein